MCLSAARRSQSDESATRRNSRNKADRTFVSHDYTDHFNDPIFQEAEGTDSDGPHRGPRGGVVTPFPERLYTMLSEAEQCGFEHIVSWQPHGRCFIVHQPKTFVEEVLPKYFKQSKLTSFQRQVNLYGFRRLTAGMDRGAYYNELFLRGRPDLHKQLVRTRVKGTGFKAAASPGTEPDFYKAYPHCFEDHVAAQQQQQQQHTYAPATHTPTTTTADAISSDPSMTFSYETSTNDAFSSDPSMTFNCGSSSSYPADVKPLSYPRMLPMTGFKPIKSWVPSTLPSSESAESSSFSWTKPLSLLSAAKSGDMYFGSEQNHRSHTPQVTETCQQQEQHVVSPPLSPSQSNHNRCTSQALDRAAVHELISSSLIDIEDERFDDGPLWEQPGQQETFFDSASCDPLFLLDDVVGV